MGQLPHLLTLFSPSAVEVQGLVGVRTGANTGTRASTGMRGGMKGERDSYAQGPGLAPGPGLGLGLDLALALSRPWFTDPLHEPHLPWVVAEIGEKLFSSPVLPSLPSTPTLYSNLPLPLLLYSNTTSKTYPFTPHKLSPYSGIVIVIVNVIVAM